MRSRIAQSTKTAPIRRSHLSPRDLASRHTLSPARLVAERAEHVIGKQKHASGICNSCLTANASRLQISREKRCTTDPPPSSPPDCLFHLCRNSNEIVHVLATLRRCNWQQIPSPAVTLRGGRAGSISLHARSERKGNVLSYLMSTRFMMLCISLFFMRTCSNTCVDKHPASCYTLHRCSGAEVAASRLTSSSEAWRTTIANGAVAVSRRILQNLRPAVEM